MSESVSPSTSPSISPSASPSLAEGEAFILVGSANITAGGENTTAQLTSPATKDTDDFQAGRIADDENPLDSIDLGSGKYTEIEWCIKATDQAEVGETYEFRVTRGVSSGPSYYPVGADCVLYHAYWDGTAVDHSGGGNDGVVTGAAFVENGLLFDHIDDRVVVTHSASLDVSNIIVCCWLNAATWATYDAVMIKSATWATGWGVYYYDSVTGDLVFYPVSYGNCTWPLTDIGTGA